MESELLALSEAASNAAIAAAMDGVSTNGPEVSRCIDSLKRLKDFPVSGAVLVSTAVDKRLRVLRQHNKEKIRLMARWLMEIWSKKIKDHLSRNRCKDIGIVFIQKTHQYESKKSKNDHQFSRNKRKSENNGVYPAKKCKNDPKKLEDQDEQVFQCFKKPYRESNVSKEGKKEISFKCCNASRNKVREIMLQALQRVDGEVADDTDHQKIKEQVRACDPANVAVSVERAMFSSMGPFNGAKKLKYRSIMFNMKDPKNPDLRRKILLGEVKPERLITMTAEEMASHQRQFEHNQIREKSVLLDESLFDNKESEERADHDESRWLESLW